VEIGSQKSVKHEKLADNIGDVEELNEDVEDDQVVSIATAAYHTACTGKAMLKGNGASSSVFSLGGQVSVHLLGHVLEGFLSTLRQFCVLEGFSSLYNVVHIYTTPGVERSPDNRGHVEHQSLDQENDGNPLVVWDHVSFVIFLLLGNVILEGEVIGVSNPAVIVGVFFPVSREMSWYPAADRVSHILLGRDDDGENNHNRTGESVTETIGEIVIVT